MGRRDTPKEGMVERGEAERWVRDQQKDLRMREGDAEREMSEHKRSKETQSQ